MRRFRAWWLLVIATVGGAIVAGSTRWAPAAVATAVIAAATAITGVLTKRSTEALEEHRRAALDIREKLVRDRHGRPPLVREITDPTAVGVHRTAPHPDQPPQPSFIRRDQSAELERALGEHPLVVVVGESTAGKSRLALEAIRTRLPDHRFIRPDPDDRTSLGAARRAAAGRGRFVVWLDDLERYLGAGGLTSHALQQMVADNPDVVVVATIL